MHTMYTEEHLLYDSLKHRLEFSKLITDKDYDGSIYMSTTNWKYHLEKINVFWYEYDSMNVIKDPSFEIYTYKRLVQIYLESITYV